MKDNHLITKYPLIKMRFLAQFPNVKLHEILENMVCLSASQLKDILNINNKDFYIARFFEMQLIIVYNK